MKSDRSDSQTSMSSSVNNNTPKKGKVKFMSTNEPRSKARARIQVNNRITLNKPHLQKASIDAKINFFISPYNK